MKQETKDEILEQIELDIKSGFENENELFESISDMFDNEEDFDEHWLKKTIAEKYKQHQQDSLTWTRPTDFDKLVQTFDMLIKDRIVCLHNAGFTKQDGEADCMEIIEKLDKIGIKAIGFCYYHSQDLSRVVDEDLKNLYLGFDSATQDDDEALQVANKIVFALKQKGFDVNWSGALEQRIEIKNMNWQKIPDDENWGSERVLKILRQSNKHRKPFWKFW